MIETGQWQITQEDIDDLANPIFSSTSEKTSPKTSPSVGSLPRSRSGGAAKQTAPHSTRGRRGPTASTKANTTPTPTTPAQQPSNPAQQPSKSAQNRTPSNRTEQKSPKRPPVQAPPRPKRARNKPPNGKSQRPEHQLPTPAPMPRSDDFYEPPFNQKIFKHMSPDDPRLRKFFGLR